jgi:pyridoxine 5-phosphate synthase
MTRAVKLGVNIDHVATLRNARGEHHPSVLKAAMLVEQAGGDGITVHLREDRRHIKDHDVLEIKQKINLPLNLEMAATEEMLQIALQVKPNACCIVPERREELTTEGGLDVEKNFSKIATMSKELKKAGILTSLFIDADIRQVTYAYEAGADIVEFHTGAYCHKTGDARKAELDKIINACTKAKGFGVVCHAGHGLTYETVINIVKIPQIVELNIGHFLMGEALFEGLPNVIRKMKNIISENAKI